MLRHLNPVQSFPERVVVIGAGGFVSGALVKRLATMGPRRWRLVTQVDLLSPDAAGTLAGLLRPTDAVIAMATMALGQKYQDAGRQYVDRFDHDRSTEPSQGGTRRQRQLRHAVYADGPLPLTGNSPMAPTNLHGVMPTWRVNWPSAPVKRAAASTCVRP